MGIIQKQSTQTTIIAYLGIIIGFVGTALIRPKILSEGEIGLLQLVLNITALFASVFTLGTNLVTVRMIPFFRTEDNTNRGFMTFSLLIGLTGCLLAIPVFLSTEWFFFQNKDGGFDGFDYNTGFYIGILMVITARIFQNILDAYLRVNYDNIPGTFSESIILKTLPILGLFLYFIQLIDFQQLIFFNMSIFLFPVLISFLLLKRRKLLKLAKPGPFSQSEIKDIRGTSFVGMMEIISAGIILYVDTIMLQWLLGEEAVGIYSTLFFFGIVIGIPARLLARIAIVSVSEAYAKNKMEDIQSIYRKSSQTLFVIGMFLFLGIWGNRYSVSNYLSGGFSDAIYVIFFIGLAQLIDVITSINYHIILVSKHYKFNLIISGLNVILLIITNYIFINHYGIVGAAIGTLVSIVIINIIRFLFLKINYGLSPFSSSTIKTFIIGSLLFLTLEFIPNLDNIYLNLLVKGTLTTILYIPIIYFFKCSLDINSIIKKKLSVLK
jgi:O-antigen/teichoic acid export membrane protein